jgi:3',5'-cyclic AMP phosphodiesterase CpdA
MPTVYFAQISDVHISELGDHHDLLAGQAPQFLANAIEHLNQLKTLDFVLFTGDLFDTASEWELAQFQASVSQLLHPYYIIPGNHDRREEEHLPGLTRHDFAQHFNPQIDQRPPHSDSQVGYWSREIIPGVQLIGLDSIKDGDWGGMVDQTQFNWLGQELKQHSEKTVLVAIHHPLHPLALIDNDPYYQRFVCDCGPKISTLLDEHPQVKLVLTGHHHLSSVDDLGGRIHIAGPSLTIYPCAYRTIRVESTADSRQRISWQTHYVLDNEMMIEARRRMVANWQTETYLGTDVIADFVDKASGSDFDRTGALIL